MVVLSSKKFIKLKKTVEFFQVYLEGTLALMIFFFNKGALSVFFLGKFRNSKLDLKNKLYSKID